MKFQRRAWTTVGLSFVVAHVLSIGGWVCATVISRRMVGTTTRPVQYHGVWGWTSWDGGFYRGIADHGYVASNAESIRFFPLYPFLARPLSVVLGGNTDVALFLIAKVSFVVALVGIYRLVTHEGLGDAIARRAIWFWVLFPGAFVLAWAYSETLLVALAVWAIWALRNRRWWLAALLGLFAGLSRPVGAALAAAAIVEVVRNWPPRPRRQVVAQTAAVIAAPLGVLAFCGYSAWKGFGFDAPFLVQDELRGTQTPLQRLWSLPDTLRGHDAFTTGLHVPFVIAFLVLLGIAFAKLPAAYGWFSAAILFAALSAQNLNSVERYAMSAFPLAIGLAVVLEGKERVEPAMYAIGGALTIALCTLALTGSYVP